MQVAVAFPRRLRRAGARRRACCSATWVGRLGEREARKFPRYDWRSYQFRRVGQIQRGFVRPASQSYRGNPRVRARNSAGSPGALRVWAHSRQHVARRRRRRAHPSCKFRSGCAGYGSESPRDGRADSGRPALRERAPASDDHPNPPPPRPTITVPMHPAYGYYDRPAARVQLLLQATSGIQSLCHNAEFREFDDETDRRSDADRDPTATSPPMHKRTWPQWADSPPPGLALRRIQLRAGPPASAAYQCTQPAMMADTA